ncbi:TlpA family protein disulfide reductase [Streptosporangium sp. CA-135522]|uniref:TlpA family protein disulfide reductase n=1 Tax=Streptosporangium sp. CA-135522 TaxID=3240072 RepID=UPI003D8C67C3
MSFPVALAVLALLVGALNLILMAGVIKRLRDHTEMLASNQGRKPSIGVGEEVDEFSATTIDGDPVTRDSLAGETVVAFFSATCGPCKEKLPKFVQFAKELPRGRDQTLVVVAGEPDEVAPMTAALSPVARVVLENNSDPVTSAFNVQMYPVILRVGSDPDGRIAVLSDRVNLNRHPVAMA